MFHPGVGFGHGNEMASVARNFAATGNYGNPFPPAVTGPTAVVPPLYPLYLAVLIKLFGLSPLFVLVADLANVLVNALIAALMPRLSRVFYGDALPGVFAGVLWLLSMRLLPQWDVSYTVLGLVLFFLLSAATIERTDTAVALGRARRRDRRTSGVGQSCDLPDFGALGALPDMVQASPLPTRSPLRCRAGCDGGAV